MEALMAVRVPVTMGSTRSSGIEAAGLQARLVWFPGQLCLPPHSHERPTIAVIVSGSFLARTGGRDHPCPTGTLVIEPAGEDHGNLFARGGAQVLVVQPDLAQVERLEPFLGPLQQPARFTDLIATSIARRAAVELRSGDAMTQFAVEGLALELLARAARTIHQSAGAGRRPPQWVRQAHDLLHDRFRESLQIQDVAARLGVHPVHLTRTFRVHYGTSVGSYVRALRLEWAASRLARTQDSIADIAVQSGFFDQSHLTRSFRAHFGITPLRYRVTANPERAEDGDHRSR
jgi:AraC family transcriptional regulator